jgi:hypothetical protein
MVCALGDEVKNVDYVEISTTCWTDFVVWYPVTISDLSSSNLFYLRADVIDMSCI